MNQPCWILHPLGTLMMTILFASLLTLVLIIIIVIDTPLHQAIHLQYLSDTYISLTSPAKPQDTGDINPDIDIDIDIDLFSYQTNDQDGRYPDTTTFDSTKRGE